jgi:hypothetical protein
MQQRSLVFSRILILAALPGLGSGLSSDQPALAEVQHALATPYRVDDPDVAGFNLKFDLQLTNQSEKVMQLPIFNAGEDDAVRYAVSGVQSKQPDGTWAYIVQSSWYGVGTIKYLPCKPLSPGRTEEIKGMGTGLVMLKKQLAALGGEPTVRLNLLFFCRQPDGQLAAASATTEAFPLRLPAQR